jgi:hypothetical protein
MTRVRNDENTLEKSIRSLFELKIPYEIIIILHLCTDKSKEIAEKLSKENKNIKIYSYNIEISRAGYETLATDANSHHSFIRYSNFCLSKCNMNWVYRWDADFLSTPQLLNFINTNTWTKNNISYKIRNIIDGKNNKEPYLFCNNDNTTHLKYIFWEIKYANNNINIELDDNIYTNDLSSLTTLKDYWLNEPWYLKENSEEALIVNNRIERLINDFGKEPIGMARASNPECESIFNNIINKKPSYVNFYS